MATGISINIGLNKLSTAHYGVEGTLTAPEKDADFMSEIAASKGFQVNKLLGENASKENVVNAITDASTALVSGGTLLITYSGHGAQIRDFNRNESDGLDETWCLF